MSSSFETSFRVKRVCDDSNIIKSFEAIGFEYTPEKVCILCLSVLLKLSDSIMRDNNVLFMVCFVFLL